MGPVTDLSVGDRAHRRRVGYMDSMRLVENWPVNSATAAVVTADGTVRGSAGEQHRGFPLASVTKLLTAYTALIALEEGAFELDTPAGPDRSTIRHLLAHASGLAFDSAQQLAAPGERRIYSNAGFEQLGASLAEHTGIPFAQYQHEALLEPLGMHNTVLEGSPGAGAHSTAADLQAFAAELQRPQLLDPGTLRAARTVTFPGLNGVLPGFGQQKPNDWGLGFELRGHKTPHWTGHRSSPHTFGHFGQSGTFLWIDPNAGAACIALTDRDFGPWAAELWPQFTDAVLAELPTVAA